MCRRPRAGPSATVLCSRPGLLQQRKREPAVAGRACALTRAAASCLEREAVRPCAQAGVRHVVFSTLQDPSKLLPAGTLPKLKAHPGYVVAHFQSKAAVQVLPSCAARRTAVSRVRLAGPGVLGPTRCAADALRTVCLATAAGE
jgi:hypothetical protein